MDEHLSLSLSLPVRDQCESLFKEQRNVVIMKPECNAQGKVQLLNNTLYK